jgi:hypothetical protein
MIVTRNNRSRSRKNKSKRPADEEAVGKYAGDAWSLAKRTAAGLNEIRRLINVETKFIDTTWTQTTSTTGNVSALSAIAQGLTSTTRVGDSIKLQHIEVRGKVTVNAAATNSIIRICVVRDLDGYGTPPTNSQIFQLNANVSAPLSAPKFQNRNRFSILYDDVVTVQSVLSQGTSTYPFYYSSAHAGHCLYLGTDATDASNGKGTVYIVTVSDETVNLPSVSSYTRILFTDD